VAVKRPDHAVSVELEIPFHDCDPLFVVWHGRYLEYMEVGRQALLLKSECHFGPILQGFLFKA